MNSDDLIEWEEVDESDPNVIKFRKMQRETLQEAIRRNLSQPEYHRLLRERRLEEERKAVKIRQERKKAMTDKVLLKAMELIDTHQVGKADIEERTGISHQLLQRLVSGKQSPHLAKIRAEAIGLPLSQYRAHCAEMSMNARKAKIKTKKNISKEE